MIFSAAQNVRAAIVKVGRHFAKVRETLDELGLVERACYVERASLDSQRILPLSEAGEREAPYFSMVLVRGRE